MREYRLPFRALAVALCFLMAGPGAYTAAAQAPAPPPQSLQIVILDGEGALNNIKQRTAHEPIVQVQDENHKPVAGVAILFLLPNSGPGGTFADGSRSFSTITDAEGKAVAHGLTPNQATGQFQIQVRAQSNGLEANSTITQTNIAGLTSSVVHAGGHPFFKWIFLGAAVGAGVAIGIVATRGSNSTTITAGTPTVGPPATGSAPVIR